MTNIEWVKSQDGTQGKTWNPTTGCTKVSPGCRSCYAERMAKRLKAMGQARYANGFKLTLHEDVIEAPLHWRKPRMVFVDSMSDLFHEDVPSAFILSVFLTMQQCPQHTFQVLTKRAAGMRDFVAAWLRTGHKILPNVWLGVSVEDDSVRDRLSHLYATPAAVHFCSYEPALDWMTLYEPDVENLDWLIIGGESGPSARPFDLSWARHLVFNAKLDASKTIAVFVKQLGANPWLEGKRLKLTSRKGNEPSEWPEDLRVREMPEATK